MKEDSRSVKKLYRSRNKSHPYLLLLPAFVVIVVFQLLPLLQAIYVSFVDLKPKTWGRFFSTFTAPFVGLKNYEFVATGSNGSMAKSFWASIYNTSLYVVIVNVLCLIIGLMIAISLNRKFKFSGLSRTLMFLPFVMPSFLLEAAWNNYFDKDYGFLNKVLFHWLHLIPYRINWFSEERVLWVMIIITVWHYFPLWTIFLLSGLQNINKECYEAAEIDGAGHIKKFYYVTLPLLRPVIAVLIFLGLILNIYYSYRIFEWEAITYYMYRHYFRNWLFGNGTAGTIMIMIVVILLVLLWYRFFKRDFSFSGEENVKRRENAGMIFAKRALEKLWEGLTKVYVKLDIMQKVRYLSKVVSGVYLKVRNGNYIWFVLWPVTLYLGLRYLVNGIGHEALWFDESYSAAASSHTIPEIWKITAGDSHPPLYFMMLRIFTLVFGRTEASLRLLSAIGILSLAALGAGPIRRAFDKFTGWVFAVIVLVAPMSLSMGQEARMYTWAAFFVTGVVVYGYLCAEKGKVWDFIMLGAFTLGAAYTHYFSLLAVTIANIIVFFYLLIRFDKKKLVMYIITAMAAVTCYVPWIMILLSQASKVKSEFWIPPVTRDVIWQALIYPFKSKFWNRFDFVLPSFFGAVAFTYFGIKYALNNRIKKGLLAAFAIMVYLTTLAVGVKASVVIRPIFVDRYIFPVVGLFLLAAAYGISNIKYKDISVFIAIILLVFSLDPIMQINMKRFNGPMFEVKNYVNETITAEDIFIHTDEHTFGTFSYYFPNNKHYLYLKPGFRGYSSYSAFNANGKAGSDVEGFIEGSENIWLVNREFSPFARESYEWILNDVIKYKEKPRHFYSEYSWYAVIISKVEPGDAKGNYDYY